MKLQYKLGIMALGLIAFTSCEKNDPFADHLEIGQRVPTCYWEVGSTTCKAGGYFSFKGQYYTEDGHTPSHSEVWYNVARTDEGSATAKIAGSGFAFTKQINETDTVRTDLSILRFEHSLAIWDGYEFVLTDSVPVSETLTPVSWNSPADWDAEVKNFNAYFPAEFAKQFEETADSLIVTNSNYASLRYLYINRQFDTQKFDSITGLNTTEEIKNHKDYNPEDPQSIATIKSQLWYDFDNPKTSGKTPEVIGYYYTTIDENGDPVYHFVDLEYEAQEGQKLQPRYESAPWVFSRYDDDLGAVVSTVLPEYIPAFTQALVEPITFAEWIYSDSDKKYIISFKRSYFLNANFRVFDTEGNVGIAHTSYKIDIN